MPILVQLRTVDLLVVLQEQERIIVEVAIELHVRPDNLVSLLSDRVN